LPLSETNETRFMRVFCLCLTISRARIFDANFYWISIDGQWNGLPLFTASNQRVLLMM